MACAHSLNEATSRTRKSSGLDAGAGHAGRREQRLGLLDRRRRIWLVTHPLGELLLGRGELGERVEEAAHHHRRHVLDDVDKHRPVEHQVERAPHRGSSSGFFLLFTQVPWMTLW